MPQSSKEIHKVILLPTLSASRGVTIYAGISTSPVTMKLRCLSPTVDTAASCKPP